MLMPCLPPSSGSGGPTDRDKYQYKHTFQLIYSLVQLLTFTEEYSDSGLIFIRISVCVHYLSLWQGYI